MDDSPKTALRKNQPEMDSAMRSDFAFSTAAAVDAPAEAEASAETTRFCMDLCARA